MELREELARIIEPTLWRDPPLGIIVIGCNPNSNIEGLKECVMLKADKLIQAGYVNKLERN